METYSKLASSIIRSTIWKQADHVRLMWITFLALKDRDGEVMGSVGGMADAARVTDEQAEDAIRCLMAPDPKSRTKDLDGRRIVEIRGGWRVVTHEYYRSIADSEERKARDAERKRRARAASSDSPQTSEVVRDVRISDADLSSSSSGSFLTGSDPDRARAGARLVPEDWAPKDFHAGRCAELGVPLDEAVTGFREHEFNRDYTDWDRRFSKWITEERTQRETRSWSAKPLRREFSPDWKPKVSLRDYGLKLGLSEPELLTLLEDCRLKTFLYPFTSEDNQFKREIIALSARKNERRATRSETPGNTRKPSDKRPAPVFGGGSTRRP